MDTGRIAELLAAFTGTAELPARLLERLQLYLDLLLKWNARVNLTAVREAEQIVTRHFGESLFGAKLVFGNSPGQQCGDELLPDESPEGRPSITLADVGSGAGFPGIPMKLWVPQIQLTLIESQNKKATFLREAVRMLKLEGADVFCGRAEDWQQLADVVSLRAVERFEHALPVAAGLVKPGGKLCLLLGSNQMQSARELSGQGWTWRDPVAIPLSTGRMIVVGERGS